MNKKQKQYMRRNLVFSFVALASLVFAACHSEKMDFDLSRNGQINLAPLKDSENPKLTFNTEPLVTTSRAASNVEDYVIGIYTDGDALVQEWAYAEMPEVYTLGVGTYKIKAHSPVTEGAAFDAPYCEGESALFEITQDNIVDAGQVECTLKNIKVTIKYDEKLLALLGDDANVSVTVGEESLAFSKTETRSGFFHGKDAGNVVDVVLAGTIEGESESITRSYSDIDLGTELVITYTLKEASVSVDPGTGGTVSAQGLVLDAECEAVSIDASVTPEEDEILDFGSASVVGDGFDINETVTDLTQPVVVLLRAPDGIAHVYVTITTTSTEEGGFADAVLGVFGTNSFDLAYPDTPKVEEGLSALSLPMGEAVINQQEVRFDVSQFVSLLGGFPGVHYFNLKVVDAKGMEAEATLTIDSRNAE